MEHYNMEQVYTLIVFALGFLCFRKWICGKYFSKSHRADGKTVIITGATSGIGKETAVEMAERGANVIMACRDIHKGHTVCSTIIKKTKNQNVKVMHLDLASFKSIRTFAETFLKEEPRLDILINNASVIGVGRSLTKDGLEMHMGVNHFGHFLLTLLLLDRLNESKPSRIITVSSFCHTFIRFNKDDLSSKKSYNRFHAYMQSKIANVLFTTELANRIEGSGVTATSVNPGFFHDSRINTANSYISTFCWSILNVLSFIFLRSKKSAAQNTIFAALDFNCQNISGVYFDNFSLGVTNADVDNPELKSWLWDYSEKVTGIQFPADNSSAYKWKTESNYRIKNRVYTFRNTAIRP